MRNAYGLEQLVEQVTAIRPDAEVSYGEPDGLDVVRSATFDKDTSAWLSKLFEVEMDERIASAVTTHGKLEVTFQSDSPRADSRAEFPLSEVDAILNGEEPEAEAGAAEPIELSFGSKAEAEQYADSHGLEVDKSLKAEPYKEAVIAAAAVQQEQSG